MSWLDRLTAGFKKTADKVADNITGIVKEQALDTATLDDIEEALIASDLGPEASKRIRDAIAARKFEQLDERGLRTILAEEIEKILAPVAKPLDVWGFPRPHVILQQQPGREPDEGDHADIGEHAHEVIHHSLARAVASLSSSTRPKSPPGRSTRIANRSSQARRSRTCGPAAT